MTTKGHFAVMDDYAAGVYGYTLEPIMSFFGEQCKHLISLKYFNIILTRSVMASVSQVSPPRFGPAMDITDQRQHRPPGSPNPAPT